MCTTGRAELLQKQPFIVFGTLELISCDLLQQPVLIIIETQIEITPRGPLSRREEQRMAVDPLVRDDPQQTLACIFQGREFDPKTFDLVKGLFGQDFGLDIPV